MFFPDPNDNRYFVSDQSHVYNTNCEVQISHRFKKIPTLEPPNDLQKNFRGTIYLDFRNLYLRGFLNCVSNITSLNCGAYLATMPSSVVQTGV